MKTISNRRLVHRLIVLATISLPLCLSSFAKAEPAGRTVKYSQQDIIQIRAKIRFSTLIVLPQDEELLDFATGDREFWIINGSHNLCYVHPAQTGIRSNLHPITSLRSA